MDKETIYWMRQAFIEERIHELQKLDYKNIDIDTVRFLFRNLFKAYISWPLEISANKSLYRVMRHQRGETHIRTLKRIYPDLSRMTRLGRANRAGRHIYYFSSDEVTALWECWAESGDVFTTLECKVNAESGSLFTPLGIHEMARRAHIKIGGELPEPTARLEIVFDGDPNCMHKHSLIDQFIKDEFVKVVPDGDEHLYKSTIAIAEEASEFSTCIRQPVDGISYPSTRSMDGAANIAILPASFDRICRPVSCERVVISKTTPSTYAVGIHERTKAKRILRTGEIEW